MHHLFLRSLALALAGTALHAQSPCAGNGFGQAFVRTTAARIGGTLDLAFGSPAAPSAAAALSVSDGLGPTVFPDPRIGTVCLDVLSPVYFADLYFLDGSGNASLQVAIPAVPALVTLPPLFVNALAVEGSLLAPRFSISRTVRVQWENPGGYQPVANAMQEPRSMHRATSLRRFPGDTRDDVLITGGGGGNFIQPVATATTELFDPLTRSFRPGPPMAAPRAQHGATLLNDGRVLITGGAGPNAIGLTSCEIYDPATNTFAGAAPMAAPRMGHATTLLADGRVLVSGGFATFQNGATNFLAALQSAQDTLEVYDPATDTWSATVVMASPRAGHRHAVLPNGNVMIVSGISGGFTIPFSTVAAPTYTATCEIFDVTLGTLGAGPTLVVGRGFFTVDRTPAGLVVAGGNSAAGLFGSSLPTTSVEVLSAGTWSPTSPLAVGASFHASTAGPAGGFTVHGGITDLLLLSATSASGDHDGTTFTPGPDVGTNPGLPANPPVELALHTATPLGDGTWLLVGGTHNTIARSDGWIFTPR